MTASFSLSSQIHRLKNFRSSNKLVLTGHEFRFSFQGRHTAAVQTPEKVSMLLLHGADPSQRDSQGRVLDGGGADEKVWIKVMAEWLQVILLDL